MGFLDRLKAKREELDAKKKEEAAAAQPEGKYNEPCALCGSLGTEKKWMGQYWHKKCIRKSKKMARGLV